ncbi:MAG: thiol-disulfide oxidoreductase DCC family protein [Cognaticolwellia sp.]
MSVIKYPPNMNKNDCVILFDGVCKLCNHWSQFIIKVDKQQRFKLCSVQSPEGQSILKYFDMPTDHFDTMLYVEGNTLEANCMEVNSAEVNSADINKLKASQCFEKSDAFLNVVRKLSYPWRLLYLFKIVPKRLRNWLYDRVALNRYTLFGQYDTCMLPTKENEARFLKAKTDK